MILDTLCAQVLQNQDKRNIHAIMKTMCPVSYHQNGLVATQATVVITGRAYCFHDSMYITLVLFL